MDRSATPRDWGPVTRFLFLGFRFWVFASIRIDSWSDSRASSYSTPSRSWTSTLSCNRLSPGSDSYPHLSLLIVSDLSRFESYLLGKLQITVHRMVHDRSNHLIVLIFLIFTPLKHAFHQHSLAVSSRVMKLERKNPSEARYVFEIDSTPTRRNSDQKSTRNFYSESDNRNSPKFRTKSKNSLTTEEKKKQVEKVLSACRSQGKIAVTITEVNHAITTAGRLYRPDDAIEIFRSINKLGFKADLMTYNNIIWCVGNAGRFDISKQFFSELVARPDLKPNVYTYGALMHACAKIKGYKQALLYLGGSRIFYLLCNKMSSYLIWVCDKHLLWSSSEHNKKCYSSTSFKNATPLSCSTSHTIFCIFRATLPNYHTKLSHHSSPRIKLSNSNSSQIPLQYSPLLPLILQSCIKYLISYSPALQLMLLCSTLYNTSHSLPLTVWLTDWYTDLLTA